MEEQEDYRRIRAGVYKHPEEGGFDKYGNYVWNPHFVERLNDWQDYFSTRLEGKITERLGKDGWAVFFVQFDQLDHSFFVDVYLDDINNFGTIMSIINAATPMDIKLKSSSVRGDVHAYTKT